LVVDPTLDSRELRLQAPHDLVRYLGTRTHRCLDLHPDVIRRDVLGKELDSRVEGAEHHQHNNEQGSGLSHHHQAVPECPTQTALVEVEPCGKRPVTHPVAHRIENEPVEENQPDHGRREEERRQRASAGHTQRHEARDDPHADLEFPREVRPRFAFEPHEQRAQGRVDHDPHEQ
jgi:hypothetical protein